MKYREGKELIIIGAGFSGLSSAALLAKAGFKVTVLEKNEQLGGRASVWHSNGFIFDMGPSWYLMPEVFEKFFQNFSRSSSDFYELVQLDPAYRIFFGNDKIIDIKADLNKNYELFNQIEENGAQKLEKYLNLARKQYEGVMKGLLYRDYNSIMDFMKLGVIRQGIRLGNPFNSMENVVNKHFSNELLKRILQYSIVFLGGNPKNTPAFYSLMSHIDFNLGVWYPVGGLGKVTEAIETIGKSFGAEYYYNTEIIEIQVQDSKIKGIKTQEEQFPADLVISSADYHHTEINLLTEKYRSYPRKYWEKRVIAPSAFIIYLGLNKRLDQLSHHNLFLENWVEHFEAIFKKPDWPEKPSYYVCVPSKTDKTVAPSNHENLFILVPVAPGLEDSEDIRQKYFNETIKNIEQIIEEPILDSIVTKRIFSHKDFTSRYNAFKGTALGLSHTLRQTALWRPSHKSKKVQGLYYTGQYTHPGIGMPMTLISSQIVSELIIKKYKGR